MLSLDTDRDRASADVMAIALKGLARLIAGSRNLPGCERCSGILSRIVMATPARIARSSTVSRAGRAETTTLPRNRAIDTGCRT
ncbi:hypothetical protein [Cereibacter johrii]|uniref:hypothetical protein n=1 Tax=Cereibacter johrii TaxID=445629 RepID=UPI00314538EC